MSAWYEREEDLEGSLNRSALWSITYGDLIGGCLAVTGEDDGWRVKYDTEAYTPITNYHRPMGTAALMRGLGKREDELAPLGWWTTQFVDWFRQALNCQACYHSEVTTNITKQF